MNELGKELINGQAIIHNNTIMNISTIKNFQPSLGSNGAIEHLKAHTAKLFRISDSENTDLISKLTLDKVLSETSNPRKHVSKISSVSCSKYYWVLSGTSNASLQYP